MFDNNSINKLNEMRQQKISEIYKSTLIDISTIKIDTSLPIQERMMQFLEQIKNPYCFLCGKIPVKIGFNETEKTLDEVIKNHFENVKHSF